MSSKSSSSKRNIQSLNTYVKIYHDAARRAAEARAHGIGGPRRGLVHQ